MTARLAATTALLLGFAVLVAPVAAASGPGLSVAPCPNGRPVGPHTACRGPIAHHSGGGGGVLTIVLSVVVGLGVAAGAAVLVRRRLILDAARPPGTRRPGGPR